MGAGTCDVCLSGADAFGHSAPSNEFTLVNGTAPTPTRSLSGVSIGTLTFPMTLVDTGTGLTGTAAGGTSTLCLTQVSVTAISQTFSGTRIYTGSGA